MERRISSVRQADWISERMDSRHSAFSYADMRLLCSSSRSCRTLLYFFSSDCLSACTADGRLHTSGRSAS